MLNYRYTLKSKARQLRCGMTDAEQRLWFHIRRKQISNVQFYRQRPIGDFITDFYAPAIKLVIEVDGSQHGETQVILKDATRTQYLESLGIHVLRFDNLQTLNQINQVLEVIHRFIDERKSPPAPLLQRGESSQTAGGIATSPLLQRGESSQTAGGIATSPLCQLGVVVVDNWGGTHTSPLPKKNRGDQL